MTCFFKFMRCVFECVLRLTVERTYTPLSLLQRGFPLKSASCVCLPAEAVRFCRSCWGHSYLSSWLASSVRSRNRGEHIRMSFVIKAGNRPRNLSWGMHAVTATVCVALWSFSLYLTRTSIDMRQEWGQNRIRHAILQREFIRETGAHWWWR